MAGPRQAVAAMGGWCLCAGLLAGGYRVGAFIDGKLWYCHGGGIVGLFLQHRGVPGPVYKPENLDEERGRGRTAVRAQFAKW